MFKLAIIALAAANANAADLFNGSDFKGWEVAAAPAVQVTDVVSMLPGGVLAVTGKP